MSRHVTRRRSERVRADILRRDITQDPRLSYHHFRRFNLILLEDARTGSWQHHQGSGSCIDDSRIGATFEN
eukprot:1117927-Rhodomonas_salina.1